MGNMEKRKNDSFQCSTYLGPNCTKEDFQVVLKQLDKASVCNGAKISDTGPFCPLRRLIGPLFNVLQSKQPHILHNIFSLLTTLSGKKVVKTKCGKKTKSSVSNFRLCKSNLRISLSTSLLSSSISDGTLWKRLPLTRACAQNTFHFLA